MYEALCQHQSLFVVTLISIFDHITSCAHTYTNNMAAHILPAALENVDPELLGSMFPELDCAQINQKLARAAEEIVEMELAAERENAEDDIEIEAPRRRQGRRKIPIEYISCKASRSTTFTKRKNGLNKKFYELLTLCGASGFLILVSETGKAFTMSSDNLKRLQTDRKILQRVRAELIRHRRRREKPDIKWNDLPFLAKKPAPAKQPLIMEKPASSR